MQNVARRPPFYESHMLSVFLLQENGSEFKWRREMRYSKRFWNRCYLDLYSYCCYICYVWVGADEHNNLFFVINILAREMEVW